ncbi:hypothetical protein H4R22_003758 [Coemansia sp. RSA 1290]|nr:hypothetical protein H4R22_003758 [Coemansia sp. RSA 1290]
MTCAPGTVCFAQGNTILCSYPVDTANQPPPASGSLVAGAQCSFVSPFDEYMCPGANGQHDYYLRCLSSTFVHFACPPGTVCVKNEGQNMFCGLRGQSYASADVNENTSSVESAETSEKSETSPAIDIGGSTSDYGWPDIDIGGFTSEDTTPAIDTGGSTSETRPDIDIGGSTGEAESEIDIGGSTSKTESEIDIGGSASELSLNIDIGASTSGSSVIVDIGASADEGTSTNHDLFDDLPPLFPATSEGVLSATESTESKISEPLLTSTSSLDESSGAISENTDMSSVDTSQPASTSHGSGLTGPVISSGLEMLLQNGANLPFTLPNIDLPEINLATVHLPDMTFDGIALTAIPLPSVTIPPMNPASLTNFNYIEEIMNKAGVTFDDLAKLPLPDLSHLNLSDLEHIDINSVMSVMNVNRISVQGSVSAQHIAEELPPTTVSQHTTTLDADGIDALLGLSVITYASSSSSN